jgi:hypothetical protein
MNIRALVQIAAGDFIEGVDDLGVSFKVVTSGFGKWDTVHDTTCDTVEEVLSFVNYLRRLTPAPDGGAVTPTEPSAAIESPAPGVRPMTSDDYRRGYAAGYQRGYQGHRRADASTDDSPLAVDAVGEAHE